MNENLTLPLVFLAGVLLGVIFFGGLWWTIRHSATAQRPGLIFFVSFLLRSSFALAGFILISGHHWERWLLCLLGFVVARLVVTKLTRPSPGGTGREASHAT